MADGETISRNRIFSATSSPADITVKTSGSGFTAVAFLDFGVSDVASFGNLGAGVTRRIVKTGLHLLEVVIAFTSTSTSTCDVNCELIGPNATKQTRNVQVSGKRGDIARVSFHAPLV